MRNFKDKVVVITGAASGMGRAYALEFAKLGSKVALNDFDKEGLEETIQLLKAKDYSNFYYEAFDVSDKEKMFDFAKNVKKHLGNAHIIINNAGIGYAGKPAFHKPIEEFERIMQINFFGVLYGCKAFLPQIVANDEGAVVNVSSIFGLSGMPNVSDYCASKFAVTGFTEALMIEFSESKTISIHCVHPGGIDTNITRNDPDGKFRDKYLKTPPEKIVKHVIDCIRQKKSKIVFGQDSWKIWLGSNFVPQDVFNKFVWKEMKPLLDMDDYRDFI
jgi:NAD(P)-dependent dehydrogenase (short-subunit alcohol dehydrogenase family)